jgi:hypothetical protein
MIGLDSTVTATPGQVSADLSGEAVILSLEKGEYFGLNEVGSKVWALIHQPRRVGDVCDAIMSEYDVGRQDCERDVVELLTRMCDEGLVQVSP